MHTLITFLGKGRADPDTGYRKARYRFPDGAEDETPYFGLALARHLRPDRVVVLGTSSSIWDVFVEHLARDGDDEALRLELMERVAQGAVGDALLDRAAPLLSRAAGVAVEPHLIGMARDGAGQREVLDLIARHVDKGTVSLDLTHGFRHLGMLGFLSSFTLERLFPGRVKVDRLWYGALDMTEQGVTPVLRLDGLQDIQRWIDALNRFDANGDYGVFAPLLQKDGVPADKANCLCDAAFRESTMNLKGARDKLRTALAALDAPLPGASGLFQRQLRQHLEWAREESYAECQRILAMRALDRRDYQRAALLGIEALVSRGCEERGTDPLSYGDREAFRTGYRDEADHAWQAQAYRDLNAFRNAMAHGIPPDGRVKLRSGGWRQRSEVLRNESQLAAVLRSSLDRLINRKPESPAAAPAPQRPAGAFAGLGELAPGASQRKDGAP